MSVAAQNSSESRLSIEASLGNIQPNQGAISSDPQFSVAVRYALNERWTVHVPLNTYVRSQLVGSGNLAGMGNLGEFHYHSYSLLAQYQLEPQKFGQPYVGMGLSYAHFDKEKVTPALQALMGSGAGFKVDSQWVPALQLGVLLSGESKKLYGNISFNVNPLKTSVQFSNGQSVGLKLNSSSLQIGLGYRF